MCIILANLSYNLTYLSPIEKHILLILCNHANTKSQQAWASIETLARESNWAIHTVEKTMKSLREKKRIIYTGKFYHKSRIPIYKVNISDNPTTWGDLNFITPSQHDDNPTAWGDHNPTTWDTESVLKDYKKGVNSLTREEKQILGHFLKFKNCDLDYSIWEKVVGKQKGS